MADVATVVAFHAHPDDEVLLTGGTLARLSAQGHRTVIVMATDGVMGEAVGPAAQARLDELRASAAALGVARVVHLGYADSGHGPVLYPDPADRMRFARVPVEGAATRLAEILREERADVLLSYDPSGGYGHRDHIKIHRVGALAAELVGGIRVLEATVPREPIVAAFAILRMLRLEPGFDRDAVAGAYSPRSAITHHVAVRRFASQKQAALAAHASQVRRRGPTSAGYRMLLRLPAGLFGLLLGREWFVEPGTAEPESHGVRSGSSPGERLRRIHTWRLPSSNRSTRSNSQPANSARSDSMVAAADLLVFESIRKPWYSKSLIASDGVG